uniref:FosG n=1 Tax=Streptomyces pulveraceus TaxID=68258 RepID=F5AMZ3_9ACTN|nr:fosG [Streptomyces pulveraceus]
MNTLSLLQGLPLHRSDPFSPPDGYAKVRAEAPVSPIAFPDGNQGWLLTRHADVKAMLANPSFSSVREKAARTRRTEGRPTPLPGAFFTMDPPDHTRYRRLAASRFAVRKIKALEPKIEQYTREHLDRMEETGGGPVDLVTAYALPIPSLIICDLLGVPYDARDDFQRWSLSILDTELSEEEQQRTVLEGTKFMLDLIEDKKKNPSDDLISDLLDPAEEKDRISEFEIAGMCGLMLMAGHESTSNMLSLGTLAALRNPDQLALLRSDPSLIDTAVEELLRYLSIVQFNFARLATEDVEIGGQLIKAGETVVGSMAAANHDPEVYTDPHRLRLDRAEERNLAFGHGIHLCIGHQLARVEMKVTYLRLFERFPTLRLAVPFEDIEFRANSVVYGVNSLPVAWDAPADHDPAP